MSETPNNNPGGGPEKQRFFPTIGEIVTGTRDAAVAVMKHPATAGAFIGTLVLPGYGTIIGAVAGPVVHHMTKKDA